MTTMKNIARAVALPAALLGLSAADAADTERDSRLSSAHSQLGQMHCRIYFGCAPIDRLATRLPLDGQE